MSGTRTPTSPNDVQCSHCGLFFSRRGIITHERHCELQDYDVTLVPLGESDEADTLGGQRDAVEANANSSRGTPEPEPDVDPDTPAPDDTATGAPSTEGGASPPPSPASPPEPEPEPSTGGASSDVDEPEPDPEPDEPEVGDRYVPVDEYLAGLEDDLDEEDLAELREMLEEYDVVDVEETTASSITAHTFEEVSP
jgi:hypothetical protein